MKRLSLIFLFLLLLVGCGKVEQPEFQPTSGVQMDLSKLETFTPVEEVYTRLSEERVEDLTPGDYGLLRPFVGSRAAFDMTIYGNSGIYNGNMGLVDENGNIVVDPVYTNVQLLPNWGDEDPKFWKLSKEVEAKEWQGHTQIHGFCSLDGTVAEPCIYENVQYSNGYIVAFNRSRDGLFRIFDGEGNLLLDSANWKERYPVYSDMGYSSVEVSENLLFLNVTDDTADYGMDGWLCDWEGNVISKDYDFVTLSGEAPYPCGTWGDGEDGYLDEYGNLLTTGYDSVSAYYSGQAVVKRNGQHQVIDTNGNVLWQPEMSYLYTWQADTAVYYQIPLTDAMEVSEYKFYDDNFEQLYPEADHVSYLYDDWFIVWKDGVGRLDNGEKSAVIEGAVLEEWDSYYGNDMGIDDKILISAWIEGDECWWLFGEEPELLAKGAGSDDCAAIVADRLGGSSVAVTYNRMIYPSQNTVMDYEGAPKLRNVNLIAVYDGWYMVEDEFSAGYMDKDGNWLFRVSLMEDMVD